MIGFYGKRTGNNLDLRLFNEDDEKIILNKPVECITCVGENYSPIFIRLDVLDELEYSLGMQKMQNFDNWKGWNWRVGEGYQILLRKNEFVRMKGEDFFDGTLIAGRGEQFGLKFDRIQMTYEHASGVNASNALDPLTKHPDLRKFYPI